MPFAQRKKSTPGHDFHDLKPVAILEPAMRELRRRDGLTIKLDHDAAGQEIFCEQEFLERAREAGFRGLAVGDDMRRIHKGGRGRLRRLIQAVKAASQSFQTGS
jgi:hypothetical protein